MHIQLLNLQIYIRLVKPPRGGGKCPVAPLWLRHWINVLSSLVKSDCLEWAVVRQDLQRQFASADGKIAELTRRYLPALYAALDAHTAPGEPSRSEYNHTCTRQCQLRFLIVFTLKRIRCALCRGHSSHFTRGSIKPPFTDVAISVITIRVIYMYSTFISSQSWILCANNLSYCTLYIRKQVIARILVRYSGQVFFKCSYFENKFERL